jgi:hypothetical protein
LIEEMSEGIEFRRKPSQIILACLAKHIGGCCILDNHPGRRI